MQAGIAEKMNGCHGYEYKGEKVFEFIADCVIIA